MIRGIREAEQCGEIAMMIDAGAAGMEFQDWMASVDAIFEKRFGVVSEDLPDNLYYDLWEVGATPLDVASDMEEILLCSRVKLLTGFPSLDSHLSPGVCQRGVFGYRRVGKEGR